LGVMLFMMLIGSPPPIRDRNALFAILNGKLAKLLALWKRTHCVNDVVLDCLNRILTVERKRISLNELLEHPFVATDVNKHSNKQPQEQEQEEKANEKSKEEEEDDEDEEQEYEQHEERTVIVDNTRIKDDNSNSRNTDTLASKNSRQNILQVEKWLNDWENLDKSKLSPVEVREWLISGQNQLNLLMVEKSHWHENNKVEESTDQSVSNNETMLEKQYDRSTSTATAMSISRSTSMSIPKNNDKNNDQQFGCDWIEDRIKKLTLILEEMKAFLNKYTSSTQPKQKRFPRQQIQSNDEQGLVGKVKNLVNTGVDQFTSFVDTFDS